jgi:hypothetical protein
MITLKPDFEPCKKCELTYTETYTHILFEDTLICSYQKSKIYNELSVLFLQTKGNTMIVYQPIRMAIFHLIYNDYWLINYHSIALGL